MNGYGSNFSATTATLRMIQMITTIVCPMMYRGVPKNRASRSARRPNSSGS